MRSCILVKTQVPIALTSLDSGNTLQMCGEMYGLVESITFIIIKDFYATIRKHLKHLVIEKLTKSIRRMANEFEEFQGTLYIFGVVNGNHILIIAPLINPTLYCC
jgi:hypothetical protein